MASDRHRHPTLDLFEPARLPERETLAPGAMLLRGFALPAAPGLLGEVQNIAAHAPWRHMLTPGGLRMSVAMTNCGALGWVSDRSGYRYDTVDPLSSRPWPALPPSFSELAARAALHAGFDAFVPDACLVNRYEPGTRLSLHQDRNERDFAAPIVSVSLGLPAVFLFGGARRGDPARRIPLAHGDVVVWGGPSRLNFHGVALLKPAFPPVLEPAQPGDAATVRINLTLRRAG